MNTTLVLKSASQIMAKMVFAVALVSGFALTQAHAQDATAAAALPATLADSMKAMSHDLKAISAQVADSTKNESSAALADDFVQMATHSKSFVADSIAQAPQDQQAALTAQYDALLDQAAGLGQQLAQALRANDNDQAKNILDQLMAVKKDGHGKFNP